jgi:hypothetical protein
VGTAEGPGSRVAGGGGARGAFLIVVAVVLGLVLLDKFDAGITPFTEQVETERPTTTRSAVEIPTVPTTAARAARPPDQVKVLPANGTSTAGLGARANEFLRRNGYNALAPIDATRQLDASVVEYRPDFEPEARALAQLLQLPASAVRPLEESPPVGDTRGADVIVVAGADLRLPEGATTTTASTTTTTARR